jgi:hypothetical protein
MFSPIVCLPGRFKIAGQHKTDYWKGIPLIVPLALMETETIVIDM